MRAFIFSAIAVFLPCVGATAQDQPPIPDGEHVVRVVVRDAAQLHDLESLATTMWDCEYGVGAVHAQVSRAARDELDRRGWAYAVVIPDVRAHLDAMHLANEHARMQRDTNWFTAFRTLDEFNAKLDQLAATSGGMASTFSIGTSIEGRPIRGIRFTGPDQPGNPAATRPALFFNGGQHAREWANHATTMYIADTMLGTYATDARVRNIVDHVEIIVLPIVNPDGYFYTWANTNNRLWRKNRHNNGNGTFGVDTNRNWGEHWGGEGSSSATSSDIYRGTAPFSEPETAAVRDFVNAEPRIRAHIDFHTAAALVLSPWSWTADLPPKAQLFADVGRRISAGIAGVNGLYYTPGPGYTTIYPAAGAMPDWMFGAHSVFSFTVEMRNLGYMFTPPPTEILPTAREGFGGVLRLCEFVMEPVHVYLKDPAPEFVDFGPPDPGAFYAESAYQTLDPASARLWARTAPGAPFTSIALTQGAGGLYTTTLPSPGCGGTLQYYLEAASTDALSVRNPSDAPTHLHATREALDIVTFSDDMEQDRGWAVGAPGDAATAGLWERGVPVGNNYNPAADASPMGTQCWVTGAAAGANTNANDVDGGRTTLTSPRFSALPPSGQRAVVTRLTYWWFLADNTDAAPDGLVVKLSNDDGATWTPVQTITSSTFGWNSSTIELATALRPSTAVRLRFEATDGGADSIVEAGVDDVKLEIRHCRRSADIDDGSGTGTLDGGVTIDDLLYYLAAFDQGLIAADYTNDDGVTIDDLLLYLQVFDEGF